MYFEICNDSDCSRGNKFAREGVLSQVSIVANDLDDDTVLHIDESSKSLLIRSATDLDSKSNHCNYLLTKEFGVFDSHSATVNIIMVDKDTFLVDTVEGCTFFNNDGELVMLNISDNSNYDVYPEKIKWITAKDFYSMLKSGSCGSKWGEDVSVNTYNYIYKVKISVKSAKIDSKNSSGNGKNYTTLMTNYSCVDYTDISLGSIEDKRIKKERLEKERQHQQQIMFFNRQREARGEDDEIINIGYDEDEAYDSDDEFFEDEYEY